MANVARPDTILAWYRKLVARKFDGSKARRIPGRPRIKREVEQLIVRMAKENRDWGYDRIAGALANLGYEVCDQTVGNVLQRHALPPAPERKRTTPGRHSFGPTWRCWLRSPKSSGQDSLSDAQERKLLEHHETELCSPSHRFGPTVRIELGENGGDVKLDGVEGIPS